LAISVSCYQEIRQMTNIFRLSLAGSLLIWAIFLIPMFHVRAQYSNQPSNQTASELIDAVNDLRVSRGLGALAAHPILMQTAQAQAEALLATGGVIGHKRPNGMTLAQQLVALGYPLAGDLSQGGYRAENLVGGRDLTVSGAIEAWLGDEPHTNTMLSVYLSDIGAGMAIGNDRTIYYVIDTALQTGIKVPQAGATAFYPTGGASQTTDPSLASSDQYMIPVAVSTALPNGDVFHTVQYGQTLWSIAIQYGTTIEQIRRNNNLGDGKPIHVGQKLLIRRNATQPVSAASPSKAGKAATISLPALTTVQTPSAVSENPPMDISTSGVENGVIVVLTLITFTILFVLLGQWKNKAGG
jgi:uncharacterized protein YkwD/LysM repeat protein